MPLYRVAAALAVFAVVPGVVFDAHAGSFSIVPVRLEVKLPRRAASFEIQNTGEQASQIQVERYRWVAEKDGDDQLEPTDDIVATPPILTLAPGQKQVVRVLLSGAPDTQREQSFRLILQETALNDPPPNTVQTLLRISMPVFITPPGAKPNLAWTAERGADGWVLVVENTGNAHAQISAARTPAGDDIRLAGYLLPGESRRIQVGIPPANVIATVQGQPDQTFVVLRTE
jgi:fimbrial chaperone protein